MRWVLAIAALLAGCAPLAPVPVTPPYVVSTPQPHEPPAPPRLPPLNAIEDANRAIGAASLYVSHLTARPAEIDRLSVLVRRAEKAVLVLRASRHDRRTHIAAVRAATAAIDGWLGRRAP
jgi:hypothetical protein